MNNITTALRGTISHTQWEPGKTASVEFSRFPTSIAEFRELQRTLGKEPHGAIALELMAFEMYRRDGDNGVECLKLNNTPNNVLSVVNRLRELYRKNGSYARPYQAAAFLKGASAANGYKPDSPYTVEVRVSPVTKYQPANDYGSTMLFIDINSNGHQSNWKSVYVVKPAGSEYFLINNNPGMYSQCEALGYGQTWEEMIE